MKRFKQISREKENFITARERIDITKGSANRLTANF
jgi:hypothetical protein